MSNATSGSLYPSPSMRPSSQDRNEHDAAVAPGDIAVGVVIGRASEYFDFFVYGIASVLVFPAVFFSFAEPLQATLYSFAVFSLAFLVRPIGSLAGMAIQRRFGRSTKLTVALFLLGVSTVGMALLPGYNSAGMWAVGLLALFRIGQGFALGASWDGLPSLLAMNAPEQRRGWYAMLGQLGAPLGFLVATALFAYLYANLASPDFLSWGWRFPFFAAFAINVVALFARLRLVVTHEYEQELQARELEPCTFNELFGRNGQGPNVLIGAFASVASYALFHIVTVFPLSWVLLYTDRPLSSFLMVQIVGAVLAAAAMPVSGILADRVGRPTAIGLLAILIGIFAVSGPFLLNGSASSQNAFVVIGFIVLGLSYGQAAGAVTSNFLPQLRYTGAALTADFAWLLGAAFAPLLALGLSSRFGLVAVSLYLLSGVACTLLALRVNNSMRASAA